jgi:hypothetical protein
MQYNCKVCSLLTGMTPEQASEFNEAVLQRHIDAELAAHLLSQHLQPVGSSTVKKHRKEAHRVG